MEQVSLIDITSNDIGLTDIAFNVKKEHISQRKNVALHNVTFFCFAKKENKKVCKSKKCVIIYSYAERWMPYTCFYMSFQKTPFFTERRLSFAEYVEKIFGK